MLILNAFLHLTSLSFRRARSCFGSAAPSSGDGAGAAGADTQQTEGTRLLGVDPSAPSLTSGYTDYAHSRSAIRACLLHAATYYALAIFGFSYLVEKFSIIDSIYLATVIFSTIGFGDLSPTTEAGRFFTISLAFYGIVILGLFLGIAGQAVVDAHNEAMEKNRAIIRFKVLDALSKQNEVDDDMVEMVDENTPNHQDLHRTSSNASSLFHVNGNASTTDQPGLLHEMLSIVFLEAPVVLILLTFALIVGRVEGWTWDESIYYGVITSTTIGFGDYAPQSEGVRLASCFMLPLMVAVFGECLARIAAAYMDRKSRQSEERFCNRSFTMVDLKTMDKNKNGVVEKGEFLAYMLVALQKVEQEEVDEIHALFKKLDVSRTGVLSVRDVYTKDWNDVLHDTIDSSLTMPPQVFLSTGPRQSLRDMGLRQATARF